jgi:adenylyltransferase/sulfurtransferase
MKLKNTFVKEKIRSLFEKENYTDLNCELQDEKLLISAVELKDKITNCENLKVISVIENIDTELPFKVDLKMPLSRLEIEKIEIEEDKEYVVICNKGISSYTAVQRIKKAYPKLNILNLKNGIIDY